MNKQGGPKVKRTVLFVLAFLCMHLIRAGPVFSQNNALTCISSLLVSETIESAKIRFLNARSTYQTSQVAIEGYGAGERNSFFGHIIGERYVLTVSHAVREITMRYAVFWNGKRTSATRVAYDETLRLAVLKTEESLTRWGATIAAFDVAPRKFCDIVFMLQEMGRETGIAYQETMRDPQKSPSPRRESFEDFEEIIIGLTLRFYTGMSGSGVYRDGLIGIFDRYGLDGTWGLFIPLSIIHRFLDHFYQTSAQ